MQNTIDEIKKREYISNFVAIKNIKRKLKTLLKDEEYLSMENLSSMELLIAFCTPLQLLIIV